eukprot:CAMPEP_0172326170 /NCGR_PEP_ID=MMETSP1058-20130122/55760_1 /TAXON_ID=83371 /ORGANISM="Detonula confervacea, Strain CCMP 353" /LENGTH=175 /DNA_ID=CAMNT_0013042887 /DNA_START=162 /DNA_END=689 /DNA_ORIENTATION=-
MPDRQSQNIRSSGTNNIIMQDDNSTQVSGFNRTKRQWARGFLWITSLLLIFDKPIFSLLSSSCAVYTMHGGAWLSHKNIKWMGASIISFLISLYALALRINSDFVNEEKAYELKTMLDIKHRVAEIVWGGLLLLMLGLTVKERIDNAIDVTSDVMGSISNTLSTKKKDKAKMKSG